MKKMKSCGFCCGGPGSESVENRMSVEDAVEKLTRSSKSQG